jgi:uncharacterized protein YjcR
MLLDMQRAMRCKARSKRSGLACRAPAVRGHRVCRMHGARSGAPKGNANALKHGHFSSATILGRAATRQLIRRARELYEELEKPN